MDLESWPSTRRQARCDTKPPTSWLATPAPASGQHRRPEMVFRVCPAAGSLASIRPTGRFDFQFPWRAPILESVNASNPVVVGGHGVLFPRPMGQAVRCCALSRAESRWVWVRREAPARQIDADALEHAHPYGRLPLCVERPPPGKPPSLRCVEPSRRAMSCGGRPDLTRSSLLYVDGHFVCLSEDGTLRLLRVNPRKYETSGGSRASRKKTSAAQCVWFPAAPIVETARLGCADSLARLALLCEGADRPGVLGTDSRQQGCEMKPPIDKPPIQCWRKGFPPGIHSERFEP